MRIDEFFWILETHLECSKIEDDLLKTAFYHSIHDYLNHARTENSTGRTIEKFSSNLGEFIKLFYAIGYTNKEITIILTKHANILNESINTVYQKYLLLGVIEDDTMTVRKNKLLEKTRDFVISLDLIYARYKFMEKVGYENITWSNLVHDTEKEFAKKFVVKDYYKPYRILKNINQLTSAELKKSFPISDADLTFLEKLDVNNELISAYNNERTIQCL